MSISKGIRKRTNSLNKLIKFELNKRREKYFKDFLENNPNIIGVELYRNYFSWLVTYENQIGYKLQTYREHLSAFRIQQYYFRAKLNPEYKYCRTQVEHFCDKVINI